MPRALYVITRAQRRGAEVDATLLAAEMAGEFEPLAATLYAGADPRVLGDRVPVRASAVAPGLGRRLLGVSPAAVRHVRAAMRAFRPDVVVAYGGEPLLHAVPAAGRGGPPVLYVRISMTPRKLRRGLRRVVFRRVAARAAALAAVAPHLAEELREDAGGDRPVFVTPTFRTRSDEPRPDERAGFRRELGVGDDDVLAAFVGNLSWEKAPDVALEALARTPANVHLAVAGQGPLEGSLRERAAGPDLAGRVHLLGPRTDVPRILAGADLVVLTSREEGRPGVLLEAALARLPAVATAVGGVPALVRDGVEGLLVARDDVAAVAAALEALASDPALRARLGADARARAPDYLPEAALPAWREAFAAALATRPAVPPPDRPA